jgi:hypothetical protein
VDKPEGGEVARSDNDLDQVAKDPWSIFRHRANDRSPGGADPSGRNLTQEDE